ncbi:MAG: ArsR/SmtB family transcription factor [Thermodesulfobacteriota bacterium]
MPRRAPQPDPDLLCQARIIHQDRVDAARRAAPDPRETERLAAVYRALGDPGRLGLLLALRGGEMCVCDLAAYLGASESAVSHQLRRLRDRGLVRSRRQGQCLYYFLDDHHVEELLALSLDHLRE